jgi:integrase
MLDEYLENSKHEKSEGTYIGEIPLVRSLKKCFKTIEVEDSDDLTYETYKYFKHYYKTETNCKNSSINKHHAYLKAVLRYFRMSKHEFLLTKKLKDDTVHTRVINDYELEEIFRFIYDRNTSPNSIVHKAAILLLYDTGCRIGELLNIKIRNIDFRERMILLEKTKSSKPRYVFFTKLSEVAIKDLLSVNPQNTWLFWNIIKDRKFNRDSDMKYVLKMIKKELGINHLSNHQFRKTMSTNLIQKGAKLKTVQTILGHADQKTTEIYVEYSSLQAKKDYEEIKKKWYN